MICSISLLIDFSSGLSVLGNGEGVGVGVPPNAACGVGAGDAGLCLLLPSGQDCGNLPLTTLFCDGGGGEGFGDKSRHGLGRRLGS